MFKFLLKIATFSCKHRYTGNWICAVPCDGHDDLCEDFEDEKCDLGTSLSFIVLIVCVLLVVIVAVGEVFVFYQKQSDNNKEESIDLKMIASVKGDLTAENRRPVKKNLTQFYCEVIIHLLLHIIIKI
jgi:hypothetical protein